MTQTLNSRQIERPSSIGISDGALRDPRAQGMLLGLATAHAIVLASFPSLLVVGLGLWWNANTISHNFVHQPFFRARPANVAFSVGLSLLLGLPQSIWRDRHLAHHADIAPRIRRCPQLWWDTTAVLCLWSAIAIFSPAFFLLAYLPGLAVGLSICAVHGHYEHVRGTQSHYGRLYNFLFCNDGFHVEHHRQPAASWRRVATHRREDSVGSRWPAVLRWLEHPLASLERLALSSSALQRFVLATHRQAWRKLIPHLGATHRIAIVGGGLFPRTAILLRELLPESRLTIIDGDSDNLRVARQQMRDRQLEHEVAYRQVWLADGSPLDERYDLVVFPLDYRGESKSKLRRRMTGQTIVLHEWLWSRHGVTALVSVLLLKRLNLMRASGENLRWETQ